MLRNKKGKEYAEYVAHEYYVDCRDTYDHMHAHLEFVANVMPLFGLIGTVIGLIGMFDRLGSNTSVENLAPELAISLQCTLFGAILASVYLSAASRFEQRTWAVESAGGLGFLLARQLVDAGEVVLDVPATLAARSRVLASGRSNKNDPNDAFAVAIAALRAPRLVVVRPNDHVVVLRLLARRNQDLGRLRNRACNRLHALLAELSPGGITKEISASSASARCA